MSLTIISAVDFETDLIKEKSLELHKPLEFIYCGIGALNASENSALLKNMTYNKNVLFIGSCGIFGSFRHISLVSASDVYWLPYGERVRKTYCVRDLEPPIDISSKKTNLSKETDSCSMICAPSISLDDCLPETFKNTVCENLELYSVVKAIYKNCATFDNIFAVVNKVGPDAHSQWKSNFKKAQVMIWDYLIKQI